MSSIINALSSEVPVTSSVRYACAFDNNWSGTNHPVGYPANAHWSPPIIASHSSDFSMWKPGELASEGVVTVAESGNPMPLLMELKEAKEMGTVGDKLQGMVAFNRDVQFQVFEPIKVTPEFPYMSSISMVAPSPDWFTGFYNVKPIDEDSMVWYQSFEVPSAPWDAGSRSAEVFLPGGDEENPRQEILEFTPATVPESGAFLNADRDEVLPMGFWKCTLLAESMKEEPNKPTQKPAVRKRAKKGKKGKSA